MKNVFRGIFSVVLNVDLPVTALTFWLGDEKGCPVLKSLLPTLSREVELLESGRFHTPVLQPGINSRNVYTTYQTLQLLENT